MRVIQNLDDVAERSAFFVRCIENLERSGQQPADIYVSSDAARQTCIDYYLDLVTGEAVRAQVYGSATCMDKHVLRISEYAGKMDWLREQVSENGTSLVSVSDALTWLYFQNPHIAPNKPWTTQCQVLPTGKKVDCISKGIDFWVKEAKYTGVYGPLVQSLHTSLNRISPLSAECEERGTAVPCLEKLMIVSSGATPYLFTSDVSNKLRNDVLGSSMINWFVPCLAQFPERPDRTQTCFEALLTNARYRAILGNFKNSRVEWLRAQITEPRKYVGHSTPTPGCRVLLERRGAGYEGLRQVVNIVGTGELVNQTCSNTAGVETSCYDVAIDHLLNNPEITGSTSYEIGNSLLNRSLNAFRSTACVTEDGRRTSCLDKVLTGYPVLQAKSFGVPIPDIVASRDFDLTGMACTEGARAVTCLDKVISLPMRGLVTQAAARYQLNQGAACTDAEGEPITCLDKAVQIATLQTYSTGRLREIYADLGRLETRVSRSTRDDTVLKLRAEMGELTQETAAWRAVTNGWGAAYAGGFSYADLFDAIPTIRADLAAEACHLPRAHADFALAVERHLASLNAEYEDLQKKIQRARGDEKRATHEAKLKYVEVRRATVRRLYDDLTRDVNEPMSCLNRIFDATELGLILAPGVTAPVNVPAMFKSPKTTYRDQGCRTGRGERVSCLQRAIDLSLYTDNLRENGYGEAFTDPGAEVAVPDIMASVCRSDDYEPCLVYLVRGRGPAVFTKKLAPALLARADFDTLPDEVVMRNGATVRIKDSVCRKTSMSQLVNYLQERREARNPPRGTYSHDGEALELRTKCVCASAPDPITRRVCADDICMQKFVDAGARSKNGWARKYLDDPTRGMSPYVLHDEETSDVYNLAGVYTVNHVPTNDASQALRYIRLVIGDPTSDDPAFRAGLWAAIYDSLNGKVVDLGAAGRARIALSLLDPETRLYYADAEQTTLADHDRRYGSIADVYNGDYTVQIAYMSESSGDVLATDTVPISKLRKKRAIKREMKQFLDDNNLWATFDRIATSRPTLRPKPYKLVISNRPRDLMRASMCQHWRSCYSFNSGFSGYDAIPAFLGGGGYIAYLVDRDEFAPTYLARVFLVPMFDGRTDVAQIKEQGGGCIDIQQPYGAQNYSDILWDAVNYILYTKGINKEGAPHCTNCQNRAPRAGTTAASEAYLFEHTQKQIYATAREEYIEHCVAAGGSRSRCNDDAYGWDWGSLITSGYLSPRIKERVTDVRSWRNYVDNRDQQGVVPTEYLKILLADYDMTNIIDRQGENYVDVPGARPLTLPTAPIRPLPTPREDN